MQRLRHEPPVDYRLCRQTVTLYHWDGSRVTRRVRRDAFFDSKKVLTVEKTGSAEASGFLLVLPGEEIPVAAGDKVFPGEGPEISSREDWAALIPAKVPGLVVVKYVDPKSWNGRICHTEAGG